MICTAFRLARPALLGGRLISSESAESSRFPTSPQSPQPDLTPSITPLGITFLTADGTTTNATAAVPLFVEVLYKYVNPTCSNYTIQFVVNGWTNVIAPVNYGCGKTGTTEWEYSDGPYIMYKPGKYTISVTVDSGNTITKTAATKTLTTNVVFGGAIIPQWGVIDAEFGRTNLGPGTDVIVGTMDDAFDFNHPWYTGNDSRGRPRLIRSRSKCPRR